jgi:hypothetical protein
LLPLFVQVELLLLADVYPIKVIINTILIERKLTNKFGNTNHLRASPFY